jgi:serine/threonine protein kinase
MDASRLQSDTPNALLPGTRLGEFELKGLLGVGGFGIVYLAFDHALEREVAVKEYMPASLAGRTASGKPTAPPTWPCRCCAAAR